MGWLFVVIFAAVAAAALWRFAWLPRQGIELMAAALLVGIAGYAWQGSPGRAGSPVEWRDEAVRPEDTAAIETRRAMSERFTGAGQVIEFSDTLDRLGMTQTAVNAVRTELRKQPQNLDLWVALGNTLVAHGHGVVSPAAEYAFRHAAALSPAHPAPPFFLGLARANAGQTEDALRIWTALLARAPTDAPWRPDLEARIAALGSEPKP